MDTRRSVPLRIEKYNGAGQVLRRIVSGRIVTDDMGRHVPSSLTMSDQTKGSSTEMDGSKLEHDVTFVDAKFTPDGLNQMTTSKSKAE